MIDQAEETRKIREREREREQKQKNAI